MDITMIKVKDVVDMIVESADEAKERAIEDDMAFGEMLAYATCLSIIRDVFFLDLKEIGLDFDVDRRYF